MKKRAFAVCVLALSLVTLAWAVAAQGPESSVALQHSEPLPQPTPVWDWSGEKLFRQPAAPAGVGNQAMNPTTQTLGQPVLGFRYAQTFGETEVAYFEDTDHLNSPSGVGTDGINVWIAECAGHRALKYASDGSFVMKIGKAGVAYATGTTLWCLRDVAVDRDGNIWVADVSHHVVKFNSSGSFVRELGVTWNPGTGNDRFNDPYSIAFDSAGNLYISDSGNHRIQVFNSAGTYVTTIGITGVPGSDNAHFNYPRHMAMDSNNRLYVADANNHRVQIFDVSNVSAITHEATIGVSGESGSDNAHFNSPQGVAVDVTRGRIYVADTSNGRVQVFDYTSRVYLRTLNGSIYTTDVAVDSAGNLYGVEPWTGVSRVQQFDSNLDYVRTYGTSGVPYLTDGLHYNQPTGLTVAPDGSIYIGEDWGRRLIKLNAAGVPQWIVGEPGVAGNDNEHFNNLRDAALDAAGRVYTTDEENCRIQIYNPAGSYYATLGTGCGVGDYQFNDPFGLTIAPNGDIYVADRANHRVQIYNSDRIYIATLGVTGVPTSTNAGFNYPKDVVVDSRGTIYISDGGNYRVQVFDSSRTYLRTIGTTGIAGSEFDRFSDPTYLTVDADDNLYISDGWGNRVQVFDKSGAYLTTVGGSSGSGTGQMRCSAGLAVDVAGNLYVADNQNHRIQEFVPQTFAVTNTDTYGWFPNGDFAYTYTLVLTELYSRPTILALGLAPESTWPFTANLSTASLNLPASGTVTVTAWVTIPSAAIVPTTWLSQTTFTVTFSDTTGISLAETTLKAAIPLPHRNAPRTLLNAEDITRMNNWASTYTWAASLRDQIVSNANAWPAKYLTDYNLTSPDLPPEGGQHEHWYICPDGTELQYVPTHSPPHYCPSTGQYYASPPQWPDRPSLYDQVIYGRRHYDLARYARFLGLTYQLTSNITYADNAASILRAYATRYLTYPQHDSSGNVTQWWGGRVAAETFGESLWLIDMTWAYDLIGSSSALSQADHVAIATGLLRPANAMIAGNDEGMFARQACNNAAIAITGLALDDPRPVASTFYNSGNGFFTHLAQGADGFWWEGSWGYHFFALNALLQMAEMGVRAGLDLYSEPNLRAMLTVPLQMAAPDLTLPRFNDAGGYPLAIGWFNWVYEAGYNHYRDPSMVLPLSRIARPWQGLLWGAESLPTPSTSIQATSVLLPQAGYAVLRAGSPDDLRYLTLDFGPHGGGHGHYDKLGYVSYALGKALGTDPGTHSYVAASQNGWYKTTVAHNTVVVDEQNQNEATGNLHRYLGLPALSLATADAGPVYTDRAAVTRTLVLNADYWLDVTRATNLDGNPHRYDWVYHNPGILSTSLSLAPYNVFTTTNGYNYLANTKASTTGVDWQATWDLSGVGQPYGNIFRSSDSISASFTITDRVASSGSLSGQLDYDFSAIIDGGAVYYLKDLYEYLYSVPSEVPTRLSVRIYGDGSNNKLVFELRDATFEGFNKIVGNITWKGWRTVELPVDNTWGHWEGDGIIDPPVSRIGFGVGQTTGGAQSGRLFVDEIALTFPSAGRQIVEDFEGMSVRVRMAGAPNTTVVVGDGIDWSNQPIPFAMARRQAMDTTFAAVFEPYRQSPRITAFQALSVTPPLGSQSAFRIGAAGLFTDTLLLVDEDAASDRAFGNFTTDATVAYLRQDKASNLQTLVLANATRLADGPLSLFTSTIPITIQAVYAGDVVFLTLPTIPAAQLRLYAPTAGGVFVNNIPTPVQRDGQYLLIALPPNPIYRYLPLVLKNYSNP